MIFDFLDSMKCVFQEEKSDYQSILNKWRRQKNTILFMPAITYYPGTFNLFDQKCLSNVDNMIWIIPGGQHDFYWLNTLKREIIAFYENDEMDDYFESSFPGIETEEFEECILLHTNELQNDPEHTIYEANAVLVRLLLTSGREAILFILLDHQDHCWSKIIEKYHIILDWLVDSGRGTGDYYARVNLYQLMKHTSCPETLPALYFKGLYNKGEIPEGFQFQYAMLSGLDNDGYDKWHTFSAVFDTGWKH